MRLQIWPTEAIENILWATQTAIEAAAPVSEDDEHSVEYHRAFRRGFETGLRYITNTFDVKLLSLKIWTPEHIQNILLMAQSELRAIPAGSKGKKRSEEYDLGFNQGLDAALWCVATSFGVTLWTNGRASASHSIRASLSDPDPFFRPDIQNILLAIRGILRATVAVSNDTIQSREYNQGFEAALHVVAQSFGIQLVQSAKRNRPHRTFPFWIRQDIEKKLLMAYRQTSPSAISSDQISRSAAYCAGFKAGLECIATSFGIRL